MSFILDALRKSEARRQHSGAPGLNSPEPPRPARRRRLLPWLGATLLAVVVTAVAVYILQPQWLPRSLLIGEQLTDNENDAPRTEPGEAGEEEGSASRTEVAHVEQYDREETAPTTQDRRRRIRSDDVGEGAGEEAAPTTDRRDRRDRRQPIPAHPDRIVRREPSERESRSVPATEASEELERRIAAERAQRRRDAPSQPVRRETAPDRAPDAAGKSVPAPEEKSEPAPLNEGVSEYLRIWELPLSARRNLPELDLTIHVYSPKEAERFVLLNGERHVAGDSVEGARIVEITRDGAVLDFRSHRFLLEPR